MNPGNAAEITNPIEQAPPTAVPLSDDERIHWLALRVTPGLGTRSALKLIGQFQTVQAIFQASKPELEAAGLASGLAGSIASGCAFEEAATQVERLAAAGAELIPITDPRYPDLLKQIYDAPPMLFARGRTELLETLSIAVVGTRRPTPYGKAAATQLTREMVDAGLTITSGMARGIDTAAHQAALEQGGNTIAVFGCGVDELYPAENRKLADRIAAEGLVLSDFPMGTPPYPQNFPMRNRIVSGLSLGVLIVEGGQYSGSAITARLAVEQDREVFAVPGNITSKMSWGPNLLIKQGAKLVQNWNDVAGELKPEHRRRLLDDARNQLNLKEDGASQAADSQAAPLSPSAREVLGRLSPDQAIGVDQLLESPSPVSASELMAALFELELMGLIRQLPGKHFVKVWNGTS